MGPKVVVREVRNLEDGTTETIVMHSHSPLISDLEINGLAEIAHPIARPARPFAEETQPDFKDDDERKAWRQEQTRLRKEKEKREQLEREIAVEEFRIELDKRLRAAYDAGSSTAVSAEARRSIAVRGYVLFTIVAAVVAMPLLAMWRGLEPQAFGAFIAPVTGIAGTIVGYWFGSAGQTPVQGSTQPPIQGVTQLSSQGNTQSAGK